MTLILAVVAAVVLLLAGGGVAWFVWHRGSSHQAPAAVQAGTAATAVNPGRVPGGATAQPQTSAALPSPPSASRAPTPAPAPAPGSGAAETAALTMLNSLRASSLARVPLDGRWVAQVASKYVGVTDPLQVAQNGTHTFYAADILAESLSARSTVNDPTKVYVLWGTDFGQRSTGPNGAPLWTTVVDAGYASHDNVLAWCRVTYPSLTPDQLANICLPRQLSAPHA